MARSQFLETRGDGITAMYTNAASDKPFPMRRSGLEVIRNTGFPWAGVYPDQAQVGLDALNAEKS